MAEVKPVLPRVTAPELMPEPNEEKNKEKESLQETTGGSKGILNSIKDNKMMLIIIALVIIILVILAYVVYKKPDKKNLPNAHSGKPPTQGQPAQGPPAQPTPMQQPAQPREPPQEQPQRLSQHENLVRSINERRRRNPPAPNPNDRIRDYVADNRGEEDTRNIPVEDPKAEEEEIKDYDNE